MDNFYIPTRYPNGHPSGAPFEHYGTIQSEQGIEAGDFVEALESGVTDWPLMHELADIVTGRETGRAHPEDVTLFKSVGLAIEDVAMAAKIVQRARDEGLGRLLPF